MDGRCGANAAYHTDYLITWRLDCEKGLVTVAKNVDGAKGCQDNSVAPPNVLVSKFEAIKRETSNSKDGQSGGGKQEKTGNGDGAAGNAGSAENTGGSAASGGSSTAEASASTPVSGNDFAEICRVTYMSGRKQYAQQEIERGKAVGELPDAPVDERAEFKGWWTERMGNGDRKQFTAGSCVKEDITVYAKWIYEARYTNDDVLIYRREIEIEAPGDKVNITMNLVPQTGGGTVYNWKEDRED